MDIKHRPEIENKEINQKSLKKIKKILDIFAAYGYNNEADFALRNPKNAYGGITQLVEYPVHTRFVICSSQIAATRPVGQAVKTPPFHGGNMGSIPVRVTKK